jgi:hypothetical protein
LRFEEVNWTQTVNFYTDEADTPRTASAKDFRHLGALKKDLGDRFYRGFVMTQGTEIVPFGDKLFAIPLAALW